MLARYVTPRKDKLTFEEAARAFTSAMHAVLGEDPTREALALALGKTALENGRWGQNGGLWNYGFGNIKATEGYTGLYTTITLNEVLAGRVVWFSPLGELTGNPAKGGQLAGRPEDAARTDPPGHPQTRMRAHASAADGALAYVRFVAGGRYASAWARLLAGDAVGYVHELRLKGYFTADENEYRKGVVSLQREFVAKLSALPVEEAPLPSAEVVREWITSQDLDLLDAAFAERRFQIADENRRSGHRELSGLAPADPDEATEPDIAGNS